MCLIRGVSLIIITLVIKHVVSNKCWILNKSPSDIHIFLFYTLDIFDIFYLLDILQTSIILEFVDVLHIKYILLYRSIMYIMDLIQISTP